MLSGLTSQLGGLIGKKAPAEGEAAAGGAAEGVEANAAAAAAPAAGGDPAAAGAADSTVTSSVWNASSRFAHLFLSLERTTEWQHYAHILFLHVGILWNMYY